MHKPTKLGTHQNNIQGNCSPVAPTEHDVVLIVCQTPMWNTTKEKLSKKTHVPTLVANTPGGGRIQRSAVQARKQIAMIKMGINANVIASRRVSTQDMNISDHIEYI
mmetsp:Transcript_67066/g.187598  ORF Transcript_67066/g.187598 Transcript_67066/m.187598 type:complete len:107 (-) Transcript_67066:787-1107(-)